MWGFGGSDDGKGKAVDSLRQAFPTVKEITKNSLYDVPITLPNRTTITFRVNLPTDFPKVAPNIQVLPPVQHRLVDQQMNIMPQAHDNLLRWTPQCSLGRTIFELVQRFIQDPPQIAVQPNPYVNNAPPVYPYGTPQSTLNNPPPPYATSNSPNSSNNSMSSYPNVNSGPNMTGNPNGPTHHTPQPVVPASFPELDRKSPAELSQMLNDETEFNKFFDALPVVQNMRKIRDDLRANNEELAKKTLSKESEIEQLRSELAGSMEIIQQQRAAFEVKLERQKEVMKQFSASALIQKLDLSAQDAEAESDALANRFLSGDVDYKDFIRDFMEKRKLFHLRSAKKESMMMIAR